MYRWLHILAAALLVAAPLTASAGEAEKMEIARSVLKDFIEIPENRIPPALLENAYGIAVIPSVVKVSLIVGGRHGTGVLAVRRDSGKWSNPSFVSLTGGSIGWQAGASSTDIILVFKSRRSIDRIARGDVTLGGDASVAAGPVGRSVSAATNMRFDAEVYSYSRARGFFAGVSVEGAALAIEDDANAAFYGEPGISAYEILGRSSRDIPESGRHLMQMLERYLPRPPE
jgi:lipid-binding SYLF domain-containing protein